jgi:oligoribonuclease NrnB/cAMP/cGMP phosphodiesterase (DHH superfamily)
LTVLHELLEQYDVDLVLQANFHAYERSKPITSDGVVMDHSKCSYIDPKGQIFVTVGTGGHSHIDIKNKSDLFVIQNENDFGFFNLKIKDKVIVGEFIANNGKIIDTFEVIKST